MIGRAAIGYPWIFNESKLLKTGEHWLNPVIDREAVRKPLDLGNGMERKIGYCETRLITLIISKEFILLNHSNNNW
jgi:tRNA-dihydrouridine synthase